ncbi:MAG: hypothetical protein ACREPX_13690, partial [Rhodanobacteraceae bacterium]
KVVSVMEFSKVGTRRRCGPRRISTRHCRVFGRILEASDLRATANLDARHKQKGRGSLRALFFVLSASLT